MVAALRTAEHVIRVNTVAYAFPHAAQGIVIIPAIPHWQEVPVLRIEHKQNSIE